MLILLGRDIPGVSDKIEEVLKDVGSTIIPSEALCKVQVPRYAPQTRSQFDAWKSVWPMSFHEDVQRRVVVTEKERAWIEQGLRRIRVLARENQEAGEVGAAGELWDPVQGARVAVGMDGRRSLGHPLAHATMRVIEAMAQEEEQKSLDHPPKKRDYSPSPSSTPESSSYLCTGLTLLLSREPCVMCSMALVHSRIGRVIFLDPSPSQGALLSHYRLHTHPSLNHHYRVLHWTGKLEEEERREVDG
ncbi:MAG: cytidine deaminase-like protein [Piptocephalis tieghemiana]|nr:MAG: cytidine deaminase-like protein [Piptocephalis tieghemiana]